LKQILIIVLFLLILCGCNSNNNDNDIPVIITSDIFEIEAEEYYVLFVKDDCAGCEKIKPVARNYHRSALIKTKLPKIYLVNVSDLANLEVIGEEDNLEGVTQLEDLKITRTPTLIVIKKGKIVEHYINATKVGGFFEEILAK
jgi:thioredoxin-related protein